MLKRHPRLLVSGQMARDMLLVALAFVLAWRLRFGMTQWWPNAADDGERHSAGVGLTLVLLWPWAAVVTRLYVSRRTQGLAGEAWDLVRTLMATVVALVTLHFWLHTGSYSRATLTLFFLLAWLGLLAVRGVQRACLGAMRARGHNLRHALLVGTGELAREVVERVRAERQSGLCVAGVVAADDAAARGQRFCGVPLLGAVTDLPRLLNETGVDQIVVALPIEQMAALKPLMQALSKETVDVRIVPDVFQYMTLCGSVEELFGLPMIALQVTPMVGVGRWLKRAVDLGLAAVAALLLAPVWLGIALAIRLDDGGPILFSQERIGLDGQRFRMWKFRSMRVADAALSDWTCADDPRRTRLGRVLRRCSLDELPQLYNVLRGEMSLVGPRPEQPQYSEVFRHNVPRYALRHKIKAGMTGWAQIHGLRGDTSIDKRIEMDLYYIEHWSLGLDFFILLRTALGGFLSTHA